MSSLTWRDHWRYRFDNLMSRGTPAMIAGLGLLSLLLVFITAFFVYLTGIAPAGENGESPGVLELAWMNLMRTLDAGTMGGDQGSWFYLFTMLFVTLGGVFIVSTFIGVLASGIESRLDELRKGRSFVIEKDHTVIYGWSAQIFSILRELSEANASRRSACVAILADKDKVEMEDEIAAKIEDLKTTRVVCRRGSPTDIADIGIVNPQKARSVIVLGGEGDDPDPEVLKTILALLNSSDRRPEPYHIVAEIRDPKNREAAHLVARNEARFVQVDELISRIMVQTCRQSGLSVVYTELLDFGGDEIYFHEEPSLAGKTFREALFAFEDSCVIGLRSKDGRVALNPPMQTAIAAGDKLIVIAEDDDRIKTSRIRDFAIAGEWIRAAAARKPDPEHTLILGWNGRARDIITELDQYVASGSTATVVAEHPDFPAELETLASALKNLKIKGLSGDTTSRALLESLDPGKYHHVVTLSYSGLIDAQKADSRTLVTLLHLRDMAARAGYRYSVVSEILDVRNRKLAAVTRADDFIVSDKLVALMLSQLSENGELEDVFRDLFDPEGSEIYLKPATDYVEAGRAVNFYTVLESAARRGEIAIGFKIRALSENAEKSFGVRVNPRKSETVTFAPEDRVIVLAES